MSWKTDFSLKETLEKYVNLNYKKSEILEFVRRDFKQHFKNECSMRTLSRILSFFDIKYIDYTVTTKEIKDAVTKEITGSGRDIGYRAMALKIRQKHGLNVSRDVVYATMSDSYPDDLARRKPCMQKKKRENHFVSKGVNWFLSIDGHDKMMGYQNSTFPLAIYGMLDQASRKILLLKCWVTNSDPRLIGAWYAQWLKENRVLPRHLRLDRGTETGKLVSLHCYLRAKLDKDLKEEDVTNCIVYGPSTSNQIERWWRELHERLEKRMKKELLFLLSQNFYNPHLELHRNILAFIMLPILQRELDEFKDIVWNSHRIRKQRNTVLPDGIPNIIYEFPHTYGLEECGFHLNLDDIEEAVSQADLYPENIDYLDKEFRKKCEDVIPDPKSIPVEHITTAFMHLRDEIFKDQE